MWVKKKELKRFKKQIDKNSNIVYLFFNDDKCLYIGQSKNTLKDRVYTNSPKHADKKWFKESNKIYIIGFNDTDIDDISRETIESIFIQVYRPKYNKKA